MVAEGDKPIAVLPFVPFLYTLDQIASIVQMPLSTLKSTFVFYHMRNTGVRKRHSILAVNIAPENATPDWRVEETELKKWLQLQGFKVQHGTR